MYCDDTSGASLIIPRLFHQRPTLGANTKRLHYTQFMKQKMHTMELVKRPLTASRPGHSCQVWMMSGRDLALAATARRLLSAPARVFYEPSNNLSPV